MSWLRFAGMAVAGKGAHRGDRRGVSGLVAASAVTALLFAWSCASAQAKLVHPLLSSFGSFTSVQGVAVDSTSGDVYVYDGAASSVYKFDASGNPVSFTATGTNAISVGFALYGEGEIAVDSSSGPAKGDIYVAHDEGSIEIFTAAGEKVGQLTEESGVPWGTACGVAVDSAGAVYVGIYAGHINKYVPSANPATNADYVSSLEGVSGVCNVAIDSTGNAYADHWANGPVTRYEAGQFGSPSASGSVVDQAGSTVAVDPANDEVYVDEQNRVAQYGPNGEPFQAPVVAFASTGAGAINESLGIAVSGFNHRVYVSDGHGVINVFGPAESVTPSPSEVETYVSNVTATSATLGVVLNPEGYATTYHFEYGPSPSYGSSTPETDAGSGSTSISSQAHIQGLSAGTVYHYRVVASNSVGGTVTSPDQTFTTQMVGGEPRLLDGRQWEMVSPPTKEGALFKALHGEGIIQASASGNAIADLASNPTEAEPQGYSNEVSVLSIRGSSEWTSQVITPPHDEGTFLSVGLGEEYRLFSEDLSYGIVQPFGKKFVPLSPEATEATPYLHSDYAAGDASHHCRIECFKPLVTGANVSAGTEFGQVCETKLICGPLAVGATPDASHVLVWSKVALTSIPTPENGGLYEWDAGRLQLVSVLPENETNNQGVVAAALPKLGQDNEAVRNAISSDGSRVIWKGLVGYRRHLYMRDTVKGETVRLDAFQGVPNGGESNEPLYMTASVDGTRIFFLDAEKLTAQASPEGRDLYEYDLKAPEGSRLTDLSASTARTKALGVAQVLGASADGSYVYFAATGILASGAHLGQCDASESLSTGKRCNLYVSHDGVTRFIAGLSSNDYPNWAGGSHLGSVDTMTSRVSPNGRWLSFMSQRDLAGYDTRDAVSGTPDEEVYLYDASTGRLRCASCDPTGARPVGQEPRAGTQLVGASEVWKDTAGLASLIPPWTRTALLETRYQPRYLSDSGRTFFDSRDALVPQDVNGTWDVYEYEPAGVGDCTTAAATFSEASGGCVTLISSGTSNEESAFLDASNDGGDVFFLTTASLRPQDYDLALDVYDAHACSSQVPCFAPAPVPPPPCDTGESCKPAQSAQPSIFGPAASQTFSGVGDVTPISEKAAGKSLSRAQRLARALKACRHVKGKRRREACRGHARKRYGKVGVKGARLGRVNGSTRGVSVRTGR